MPSQEKNGLYSLIRLFIHDLKVRNYAHGTIACARIYLRDFALYLEDHGLYDIQALTKKDLEQYLHYLTYDYQPRRKEKGSTLAPATVYSRWQKILRFFIFLVDSGHILYNPALRIEKPIVKFRKWRRPLTLLQVQCLLSQPDLKTKTGLRDRAILEMFYSTGLRKGELLGLEIFDVDLTGNTVRVRKGKGGKERIVPLGEEAAFYLERYLNEVRKIICKTPGVHSLFLNFHGGGPLDSQSLQWAIRKYADRSRIKKKITAHLLRHTFATHMLEGGADIFAIQKLLGHARAETTQIYAKASLESLEKVHRNCHPRGKRV